MDKLSENNAKLFHKLMDSLLFFANKDLNVIKNCSTLNEFHNNDVKKTIPIREKVFSDNGIIDGYISKNPDNLPSDEINIIDSWKKSLEGKFFIVKYEKEYALFLDPEENKVYGVKGITDSFKEMLGGCCPIVLKIRLLQFKDNMIYDGIFFPYQITFGGGMRSSLKAESETAMQKYGVITSFEKLVVEKENSDGDMIRFYMKNQNNRDRYFDEIEELRNKSPESEAVYQQEEARIISKDIKKSFKAKGIKGHFAALGFSVIASAPNKKELEENIKKMVPDGKLRWVYRFKI